MSSIVITLDSVRKYRTKAEYRTVPRASWLSYEVVGDGPVIQQLCSRILEDYPDCKDYRVSVYRDNVLCFLEKSLEAWAQGKGLNNGNQPEWLRRPTKV